MKPLDNKLTKDQLKIFYLDVVNGYTEATSETFGKVFIRHTNLRNSGYIDECRESHFRRAKEKGLPTNEEQIDYLASEGLWSKKDEARMREITYLLDGLRQSKQKVFLQKQIDMFNKEISKSEKEYEDLESKRNSLLGLTCESFSIKKANEYFIFISLCKDQELKTQLFDKEEYDTMSTKRLNEIVQCYNTTMRGATSLNLKRIALSSFFLNYFYLCDDNPMIFYGSPVVKLSFNQVELFGYARHYKHLLSEAKGNPPDGYYDDPDKLEEWINAGKNADKMMEKAKTKDKEFGASSIVGATPEDLKRLGYTFDSNTEVSNVNLSKSAAKSKKESLGFEDMIKIHEGKKVK